MTTSQRPIRFGALGAAAITPNALIHPARKVAGVQVDAVAARDPQRAAEFAAKHGIARAHSSYAELVADPDIDAIYNPLPNSLHCEWTLAALHAGKHVLCEKPFASNAEEAMRMAGAGVETGRILVEAFHYRYHPLAARMKAILDSGELGVIRHVEAHICFPLLRPGDIRYSLALGGGAMMDAGCYAVNLVRYLAASEPEVVYASSKLLSPQVDRCMEADLYFPTGVTGRIVCSLLSAVLLRVRAVVRGDAGEMAVLNPVLPHLYHRVSVRTAQGVRHEKAPGDTTYTHQLRAFVEMVNGGAPMPTDAADAVANMRVIDDVYRRAGLQPRG